VARAFADEHVVVDACERNAEGAVRFAFAHLVLACERRRHRSSVVLTSSMPVFDAAATAVLEQIARSLWGFKPNLMPHIVEQRGPVSALSWFVRNMPKYEGTL